MADALCGPSNPLQTFQKATSVDRTLQQDRLRSHLPPDSAQGFRSPDPRAGSLDAEFAAFEAGQPFHQSLQQSPPRAQVFPNLPSQHNRVPQNTAGTSWAADFQRLRLGNPAPVPQAQFRSEAPMHRSTHAAGWHNEFMKHQQSSGAGIKTSMSPIAQSAHQPNLFPNAPPILSPSMGQDFHHSQILSPSMRQNQMLPQQQGSQVQPEPVDEAAFEAAFAEAASADLQSALSTAHPTNLLQTTESSTTSTDFRATSTPEVSGLPRIGSDLIPSKEQLQHQQQQPSNPDVEADSLALTAGELLHSVRDNSSEKFRQSNFLALMRRLRDREVVVRGDDIVESQSQSQSAALPTATITGDNNSLWSAENIASIAPPVSAAAADSSTLHPGGPSYPSPPPPAPPENFTTPVHPVPDGAHAEPEREEHFLDTRPMAAGEGLEGEGGI